MDVIERAIEAAKQAIVAECAKRGGACNGTPEGLLAVNASFDPANVVRAVLTAIREPGEGMSWAGDAAGSEHAYSTNEGESAQLGSSGAKATWQAMIDHALSEHQGSSEG